mgnify:CR=1 FL=1
MQLVKITRTRVQIGGNTMSKKMPKIALLYDFDKTLSTRDMQEYSFIPNLGMSASDFWQGANDISVGLGMDRILAYMYLMIKKAKAQRCNISHKRHKKHNLVFHLFSPHQNLLK